MVNFNYSPVTEKVLEDLALILGKQNISTDEEKIESYSRDEVAPHLWKEKHVAEVVCFPESVEQVSALMRYANEHRIPVTPRGAGTGLSGGAVPAFRGIELSFEKMNRILDVDLKNLTITVEPGVVTSEINRTAASFGLLYAGDPCSGDASFIGGNVAENAGGNKVIKYGPTGGSVLGMEVVLADGSVSWFGGKRRKDVTGYDFVHLMVGSEGTLGIITKIVLKLMPLPAYVVDLLVPFKDIPTAMEFVPRIMLEGKVTPSSIEFMDGAAIRLAERFLSTRLPCDDAEAHLIIQLEGVDRETLSDDLERIGDLCLAHGALEVFVADNRNTRDKLWKARKSVAEAVWAYAPIQVANEDIVVPTSEVPELMAELDRIAREKSILYVSYGHVGDGNMHVTLYLEGETPDWKEILEDGRLELYRVVRRLGGTLTGEHGVGLKRAEYIPMFLDEAQIDLIRRVKLAFDPNNILNPGKIVPWE